jgi:hypothetical protein
LARDKLHFYLTDCRQIIILAMHIGSTSILFEILLAPAENSVLTRREIADRAGLSTTPYRAEHPGNKT